MRHICKFTISILLWICVYSINAQNQNITDTVKIKKNNIDGLRIELDVAPVVKTLLAKGETYSFEGAVQTTLLQKYYPVVEFGYAGASKISTDNVDFNTNGVFFRVGSDFSVMKQKENSPKNQNYFLVGGRLGFSHFTYNLSNIVIRDNYWNESKIYNFENIPSTKLWFEIAAGIRVEVIKNIYMGWTLRNKRMLTNDADGTVSPWYIPGFGVKSTSAWAVNYAIGYQF
ncbi:MAG: DUF6048 family protein [Paludibacter sp.]|nr:DUF6048 family protein [Paludibacter sp.]